MNLRNNQITVGELLSLDKSKRILLLNFPQIMNPFLLNVARKMTLENTLKLATGPHARDQILKIVSDLEAV